MYKTAIEHPRVPFSNASSAGPSHLKHPEYEGVPVKVIDHIWSGKVQCWDYLMLGSQFCSNLSTLAQVMQAQEALSSVTKVSSLG